MRLFLSLLILCVLSACGRSETSEPYVGYMEVEYTYIAAPAAGWLEKVSVREGKTVSIGTPLFQLNTEVEQARRDAAAAKLQQAEATARDLETGARREEIATLEAQLHEADANLRQARAERDRWLPLVAKGVASKARGDAVENRFIAATARSEALRSQINAARLAGRTAQQEAAAAAVKAAQDDLALAEHLLSERQVSARVSGRVEHVFHQTGELIQAGAPVLALVADENSRKVKFFVPQGKLSTLSVGSTVLALPSTGAEEIPLTISFIAAEAEFTPPVIFSATTRDKLVFMIEAKGAELDGLRPGQPVDVVVP